MNQKPRRQNHLVISAIGTDKPGLVKSVAELIAGNNCNIDDSKMSVLGGEFALIMMVTGSWDAIAKLESALPPLARKLDLALVVRHTEPRKELLNALSYTINVVSMDHPGIVQEISSFFSSHGINIAELETGTYAAPHTGAKMFSLNMIINIPVTQHIGSLREHFMVFCDDRNLDAVMEPVRNA